MVSKPLKKSPKRLSLESCEGVEKTRKFATSKVLRWGLIIYAIFIFRSCFHQPATQQQQQVQGNKGSIQSIEQILPSRLKHYNAAQLEFKKKLSGVEVYKNGVPLGIINEAYVLTSPKTDVVTDVVGYLNDTGVYNNLGEHTGNVYKGEVLSLDGNKLGTLKGQGKTLESIVKGDEELMKAVGTSYVIMAKEPSSKEYSIIGVIDDYEHYLKSNKSILPF